MIQSIEESKVLREYCRMLGRKKVAERIIAIAQEIVKQEGAYQSTLEYAGMIRALAMGCRYDSYWDEKQSIGKTKMLYEAKDFIKKRKGCWGCTICDTSGCLPNACGCHLDIKS